jgi:hypothetical protein
VLAGDSTLGLESLPASGWVLGPADDALFVRQAQQWMYRHPLQALQKFLVGLGFFWYFSAQRVFHMALNLPLCALALMGLMRGAWRRLEVQVIVLMCLYYNFMYAAFMASVRYSLQVMPFVILLAAAAVLSLAPVGGAGQAPDSRPSAGRKSSASETA